MQSQQFSIIICNLFAFCFVTRFSHCLSLAVQVMSYSGGRVNYHCVSDLVALFPVLIQLPSRRLASYCHNLSIFFFFLMMFDLFLMSLL